jgi:hypothetical protein
LGRVLIAIKNDASGMTQASRGIVPWNPPMMRRASVENPGVENSSVENLLNDLERPLQ